MSYYPNGPAYRSYSYNNIASQASQSGPHGGYASQEAAPNIERSPSFNAGDDGSLFNVANGDLHLSSRQSGASRNRQAYGSRRNANNPSSHPDEFYVGGQSPSLPTQAASYASNPSGYQHTYPPQSPRAYNPQEYAPTQSQYNQTSYGSAPSGYTSSSGLQPYVPAAYSASGQRRQSIYTNQTYNSPPNAYGASIPYPSSGPLSPSLQSQNEHSYTDNRTPRYPDYQSDPQDQYSAFPRPPSSVPSLPVASRPTGYTSSVPYSLPYTPSRSSFSSNDPRRSPSRSHSNSLIHQPYSHISSIEQSTPYPVDDDNGSYSSTRVDSYDNGPYSSTLVDPHASGSLSTYGNPLPPTPGPPPPLHGRPDSAARHPQSRPLPGPPEDSGSNMSYNDEPTTSFEDVMKQIDETLMTTRPSTGSIRRSPRGVRGDRINYQPPISEVEETEPQRRTMPQASLSPDETYTHTGYFSTGNSYINYNAYSDASDAEAEAGVEMLRQEEEREKADNERRRAGSSSFQSSHGSQRHSEHLEPSENNSEPDDYVGFDMSLYEGGPETNVHYGDSLDDSPDPDQLGRPLPMPTPYEGEDNEDRYDIAFGDNNVPYSFPRTDTGGTGGLSEPGPNGRNKTYDEADDATLAEEGDDNTLAESDPDRKSGSFVPANEDYQSLFYHPEKRPLPPAPSERGKTLPPIPPGAYQESARPLTIDPSARASNYYAGPDAYGAELLAPPVPRSSSLSSHSSTPQVQQPIRSKTDAEERRKAAMMRPQKYLSEGSTPQSAVTVDMLPTIRKEFVAAKLSSSDFKKCTEPWALSAIVAWIKQMCKDETDLKEQAMVDGIVALFTHKVPTMNTADAETLGARVVQNMFKAGTLVKDEEWVKFGNAPMSGVIYQITGTGCYSPKLHVHSAPGRCYSHHCMRTLKKINLHTHTMASQKKSEDWVTFYKLKKEDLEGHNKKEVSRQHNLHEIITTEDGYIEHLDILRTLYRDQLAACVPPVLSPKRLKEFISKTFGRVDAVKIANEEHLLAQLKYTQQEQGPWIDGFSDIFREWVRKARQAYLDYAAAFPNASFLIRQEAERNVLFKQFLAQVRDDPRAKKLDWDTFLKAPLTRLPRYDLLLATVLKNSIQENEEKAKLRKTIEEIKAFTFECEAKVGESAKKVNLAELSSKLKLREGMDREVNLNLNHLGRELIFRGDLQRTGSRSLTWLETHAILFDHYLVLAKTHITRDATGGLKYESYDVSKLPIPMDLLVLESTNDDPVSKSAVRGIGGTVTTTRSTTDARFNHLGTGQTGPGTLQHANTSTSVASTGSTSSKSMITTTVLDGPKDEKIMFPFRIKHLGKADVYTLYAPSASNRRDWCEKIIEAKTKHAAALFAQNAEPFRLRVLADAAFGYDAIAAGPRSVMIQGTPLDRAIQDVEKKFQNVGRPAPICRATVNCATTFTQPYPGGKMVSVGTDYGVYISDYHNPRGWTRVIQQTRVTQIAVLEEFNLFLVLADKSLIAYHLDAVCPVNGVPPQNDSSRRAPQKLSGARDVGFFAIGRMKDRTLVFYKKRDGIHSTFKVLEPILHRSATSTRSRLLPLRRSGGSTDFFRDYDEFYIPTDTYSLNLFTSSLAVSTARGIEVLTLDKKLPWSVPNFDKSLGEDYENVRGIANRIANLRPLGMFRLSESEFLVVLDECAVYVNKHGDVNRSVVMEFVGKAKEAAMQGPFLLLFDEGFVEVRNAVNGRLRQVISGRDIRCLDDGGGGGGGALGIPSTLSSVNGSNGNNISSAVEKQTVKICMQHPEYEKSQVVVELVINEGQKE
ncbi:MAG: hypothetical protein M1834_009093 [Cirrosporium novae-zelandiae]|nr:MAG: hypothetical protein M1834_009093 [Cirrosporium novae-zelandiae]